TLLGRHDDAVAALGEASAGLAGLGTDVPRLDVATVPAAAVPGFAVAVVAGLVLVALAVAAVGRGGLSDHVRVEVRVAAGAEVDDPAGAVASPRGRPSAAP